MAIRSRLPFLVGMSLLLTACSWEETVYHHFIHPEDQPENQKGNMLWMQNDTLHFADTLYFGKNEAPDYLFMETILRHNDFYPYEDIYLNADITAGFTEDSIAPASHSRQTFNIPLVNGRHHWAGKGWGSLYTTESTPFTISLPKKLYRQARPAGNDPSDTTRLQLPFHIAITSAMRDEALNGCESIGLRLYTK